MASKTNIIINGAVDIDIAAFCIHFGTIHEVVNFVYKPAGGMKKAKGKTEATPKTKNSPAIQEEELPMITEQSKEAVPKKTRRQRRRCAHKKKTMAIKAINSADKMPQYQIPAITNGGINTENKFAPLHLVHKNSNMVEGLHLRPVNQKKAHLESSKKSFTKKYSQKIYRAYKGATKALRTRPTHYANTCDIHTIYMVRDTEEPEDDPEDEALRNIAERVTAKGRKATATIAREPRAKGKRNITTTSTMPSEPVEEEVEEEEEEEHVVFNPYPSARENTKDKTISRLQKQLEKKDEDMNTLHNKLAELTEALAKIQEMVIYQNQIPQRQASVFMQQEEATIPMSKREIQEIVANQIKQAEMIKSAPSKRRGRPYPPEIDSIPYPPGYTVPNFRIFNGVGNPDQHLAHFIATCGNTGSNDALLLRQFSHSLSGVAFEWYYTLENNSIYSWTEMEEAFRTKFAAASDSISIADLVNLRRRKDERMLDYFTRWRNMSIKCEQPLEETQAVGLLIGNVDDWMAPFICTGNISTYKELFTQVGKLERMNPQVVANLQPPRYRRDEPRRTDPRVTYSNDASDRRNKEVYSVHIPQDNKKYQTNRAPIFGEGSDAKGKYISLEERKSKDYSFKKEKTMKIFKDALKSGLQLPEPRRPGEATMTDEPNYCPYHRILGHTIEECYVFQDWVEQEYKAGRITLSKQVLKEPCIEEVNFI